MLSSTEFSRRIVKFSNSIATMKLFTNYGKHTNRCSRYAISGSQFDENSYCGCLDCATVWSCKWVPTSIFSSTLKVVRSSKTLALSTRLYGVTSQKTVILRVEDLKAQCPTSSSTLLQGKVKLRCAFIRMGLLRNESSVRKHFQVSYMALTSAATSHRYRQWSPALPRRYAVR
jgi:hypothetical protein